jgi:hypothetical protein
MKSSPEGGFTSRKWMYGMGSIVGGLNPALLEEELQVGQYILVVLADEFGFTANATSDSVSTIRKQASPQKAQTELVKRRNPFSSSPAGSPFKRPRDSPSGRQANERPNWLVTTWGGEHDLNELGQCIPNSSGTAHLRKPTFCPCLSTS